MPYCEKKRVEFPLPQSEYRGRGRLLHIEIFDGSESGEDQKKIGRGISKEQQLPKGINGMGR